MAVRGVRAGYVDGFEGGGRIVWVYGWVVTVCAGLGGWGVGGAAWMLRAWTRDHDRADGGRFLSAEEMDWDDVDLMVGRED